MRNHLRKTLIGTFLFVATLVAAVPLHAGEVAKADLDILGLGLEVDRKPVTTGTGVPSYVQTIFGGKSNAEAPSVPGLSAIGELTGPGITTPITLHATPGKKFAIPALQENGEYSLQNIRLVGAEGEFLQQAVPSFAIINVTDVLKTELRVRQLTPEELRERGISVDLRNYEVYEYTVIFGVDEERVEIPYPVIIDKRTHAVQEVKKENGYKLPPLAVKRPPRFPPPAGFAPFDLSFDGGGPPGSEKDPGGPAGPSIPAAIIVPNGFGVLHQFFAVVLQVSNSSPEDAQIRFDNLTATITQPQQMRVAKVEPAVSLGQPVPVYDSKTGTTFLVAGAQGKAEWTLEALKAGTHTVDITVEATYQKPGQEDFRLRGRASTAIVVSDPRFQINFSHPDNVREDEEYTAYAFITNMSPQAQHVRLDLSHIPACNTGAAVDNICRMEADPITELNMQPGEMVPVPYKLMSQITGHVFAGAGTANDEALAVSVKLHMGVSASGIPLSPATLVMPHYAKFLPKDFIAANMQLLGLGYSLATAPLNQHTAKFPRVITTDVFQRAQEIARAGQRIFVTRANVDANKAEENRDSFFHLALDLLGNIERTDHIDIAPELIEWDELRRSEKAGRRAAAAMARQLETQGLNNARTPRQFVDDFAAATAHRSPFVMAWAHGAEVAGKPRPYAVSMQAIATGEKVDVPAEETTGWVRTLPTAELTRFDAGSERGEMALLGRWKENVRVVVVPQSAAFTLHLIYPDTANGSHLRAEVAITNATVGQPMWIELARGARSLVIGGGANGSATAQPVAQTSLRVLGAAQDLYLNEAGKQVSVLFNRPIKPADVLKLRDEFALTINVAKANYSATRKNTPNSTTAPLQIPSAALQQDARIINITFDKSLSRNASYLLAADNMVDLVTGSIANVRDVVPRIDNDAPGGILTGRVLLADNTPVPNAEVVLDTWGGPHLEVTGADGRYMYEFVARDIDNVITGYYEMRAIANGRQTKLEGAVRLPGEVHTVNLVFLGRGVARGYARYDDGTPLKKERVTVGSTLYHQHREDITDENGYFEVGDLPVGPLTFAVMDEDGRVGFAANAIRTSGEVITQDLLVVRRTFPGVGTVRVMVVRSDTNARVPGASVGVYTQGYSLMTAETDSNGFMEFRDVPAGLISVIGAHYGISRDQGVGVETELRADQILEQTLIIPVPPPGVPFGALEGVVTRDDPAAPSDRSKDQPVAGALITVSGLPPITANADGSYHIPELSSHSSGEDMLVFDPATGRRGLFTMPTLEMGKTGRFSPRLSSIDPNGAATIRVRLTSATGAAVSGYRVFEPGFPPENFSEVGNGVYEMRNVHVPGKVNIVAVPKGSSGPYGEQMAFGQGRVDFPGQVAIVEMRLPGEGTILTKLELRQPQEACPTSQPCYTPAFGKVAISYSVWDEIEQMTKAKTVIIEADPATQINTFRKVPALQVTGVYTDRHPAGFASSKVTLGFEGDARTLTLRLESVGDVTGRVFAHDRQTPVGGALVKLTNGKVIYGSQLTQPDGSFRFAAVQASLDFRIVAEYMQDGIHRKGYVDGTTPSSGGPVSNLTIVMREQSTIEGQVVDMDGNPVPLARFWAQELVWPNTEYGKSTDPLQADINGRFILTNVFTGSFRISAVSPEVQEERGHYQGVLRFEGDTSQLNVKVPIGAIGFGTVTAKIIDSTQAYIPIENAEVTLYRGRDPFDVASSDDRGLVTFRDVPAEGTYRIRAYSKTVGRAGNSTTFEMTGGATEYREIVLDFLGKVAGYVTDPEATPAGSPVRGAAVQVEGSMLGEVVATRASTDTEGKFSILGVPEGSFKLFAYDYDSGRMAFGPSNLEISKVVQEYNDIHLQLEKTATLTVNVYLPNDAGQQGELAPQVDVLVTARDYFREAQGNSLKFPKMITRYPYKIEVRELGGEYREIKTEGAFPAGATTHTHNITLQSTGTVEVLVLDGSGAPVTDATVMFHSRTYYTPADGIVRVSGIPFGHIGVSAKKGTIGASASGHLQSRSIPLKFTLNLGLSADVTGTVEAEEGIGLPSHGTRVVVNVTSRLLNSSMRLEAFTDANGSYTFSAIPIGGTRLKFLFYGPDDTTIGHEMTVDVPDSTSGTFTIPRIKIDATPPRVLSIDPPSNSTNVSPSSTVTVTFSEPIGASFINRDFFSLRSTATDQLVNITLQPSVRPDGTFQVRMIPPAPPAGQKYPLASNVLYRISVAAGLQDTTGNAMKATVGANFTTVNYTEPTVVRVDPASGEALQSNATFRVKFNKAIDPTSIEAGYGGVLKLEKLGTRGGEPVSEIPLSRYIDPSDPTVMIAAPTGVAIAEASFYRLSVSGFRDTQTPPNTQKDAKVVDFFSYDTRRPIARIKSPIGPDEKLVSGVLYTAEVEVVDEGTGQPSIDVESVDWFDAAGKYIKTVSTPPYSFTFTAPATSVDTTYTLQVSANDLSLNRSPAIEPFTWNVIPNAAPANVTVTNTPASAYPAHKLTSGVTFTDEGVKVTVVLKLAGKRLDGTDLTQIIESKSVTRTSHTAAWPAVSFNYALPLDLAAGTAKIVAEVTDVAKTGTGEAAIEVLNDTIKPEVLSFLPKAETRYSFPGTYVVEVKVRDAQTGIKSLALTVGGEAVTPTMTVDNATGIRTYKFTASVKAKNADTRIAIVATATDNRDNVEVSTSEVVYERVDDATVPQAAWISPLDTAAIPFGISGWQATLRIQATDDKAVTGVSFVSDQFVSAPAKLTAPKSGTTNVYEAKVTFKEFPAGTTPAPFVVTAVVEDADPTHNVELPITLYPVVLDSSNPPAITTTSSISSLTDDPYVNKTLVVRGSGVRVTILVPLAVKNLIVLDGAIVSTFEETKLDLTIGESIFIDADSKIDVSGRGYLGGLQTKSDNSFTNDSKIGRTLGGTTTAGANNADGSYAGIGGSYLGATNATYGSITEPADFGAGGGAEPTGSRKGSNGGGAVILNGATDARFVVAGRITADAAASTSGAWAAGAGGSINLRSRALITGPATRMTANGGDEGASLAQDLGGGGGRIAVRVAERLDADATLPLFQARGGRNGGSGDTSAGHVDGGAGTIYLKAPQSSDGELIVSSYDERYPTSAHRSAGTPLSGTLAFDKITIGPRALARFDAAATGEMSVDSTATVVTPTDLPSITVVSVTPAAGSNVAQSTSIQPRYTAQSISGIRQVRTVLSVQPADVVSYPSFVTFVPETTSTITIPANAAPGNATLKVVVTDRAGRVAESAPMTYTIVNNAGPVIDLFQVTPSDEIYANHSIAVSAKATDDVSVTDLTLTSSAGTVTSATAVKPTPASMTRDFTVAIPSATPSGTTVTLTLSTTDGFAGRTPTTATATVKVKKDAVAPAATIVKPAANQQLQEAANATFDIEVTAADAEVAVQSVTASFEGVTYTLAPVTGRPNVYAKTGVPIPDVDGTEPVAKTITVNVTDFEPNTATQSVTVYVKPLIDPNAPKTSWVCGSPNALYPPGYATTLSILAVPSSSTNGVSKVEFIVDGGTPLAATHAGNNVWNAAYTVPATATNGALLNVRANATSTAGNVASLVGTVLVVTGTDITTTSTIEAGDAEWQNRSVIVRSGGTLTITGAHTLKHLVVLNGGKLIQKHVDMGKADLLTVDRLYVGCGGSIDVTGAGYARGTTYPGAGNPDDASGGSHIGRGGLWNHAPGGSFGSIYRPSEAGGGGHPYNASAVGNGGGSVRVHATGTATVDGAIAARGVNGTLGSSAGGSVWITTAGALAGSGSINVTGGDMSSGAGASGGGGSIALEYATVSGSLTSNLVARGGAGLQGRFGGAGSIYLKSSAAAYGDLIVDNTGVSTTYGVTELPSFGRVRAASVAGANVTLEATRWMSPSTAGNWVRAFAPDGSVRGTFRIASVTNPATTVPVDGYHDVPTQDAMVYDGFVVYSPAGLGGRKFVAARYVNNRWEYDNDTTFTPFAPQPGDALIASFTKDSSGITDVVTFNCTQTCSAVNGMPVLELVSGDFVPNGRAGGDASSNWYLGRRDAGELFLRPDTRLRGIVLSNGANASITLADASGVAAGDVLRGIYRFDSVKVTNARVVTEDLLESTSTPAVDATSSLISGNVAPPSVTAANVSLASGLTGPVLVGTANAVTDPETPLFVVARNATRSTAMAPVLWNATTTQIQIGNRGGMSVARPVNGHTQSNAVSTLKTITGSGYVSFAASQTNKSVMAGLAPADTTPNAGEPGIYGFKLLTTGAYELWANGANAARNGTYTTSTIFRIEKTPAAIRWFVNGAQVHEVTSSIPAKLLFDVSFEGADSGELHSIEYDTTAAQNGATRVAAAANGSFKAAIAAQPGDEIVVSAWDSHTYTFRSAETTVATIGNDIGVASVTLASSEITGGRTLTGTATLRAAAGPDGALVSLTSNNPNVTVPVSITVATGETAQTFTITTKAVLEPVDVIVSATYSGVTSSATLRVLKDATAPAITITSPAPNAEYIEGSTTKIPLQATVVDEDTGVSRVVATLNGVNTDLAKDATKGPNVWTAQVPAPFIDDTTNVTMNLTVTATDNNTNSSNSSVPVVIKPVLDGTAPTLAWECGADSTVASSSNAAFRVTAKAPKADNPLQSVEFRIAGEAAIAATNVGGDTYEAQWTPPAADATYAVTVVATVAGGASATVEGTITAVTVDKTFSASTTVSDATWDNKSIAVTAGTLTLSGARTFKNVLVLGGSITHPDNSPLKITTTGSFYVACGATVNVTGRGYRGNATHPAAKRAYAWTGGSHIGRANPVGAGFTYGSVYRPFELGGSAYDGSAGGGALRIEADSVTVNGSILANANGPDNRTGAGGSVWITTRRISGTGAIEARSNRAYYEGGGGGAISVEYKDASSTLPTFRAGGGVSDRNAHGGAGTIYVKGPSATYGDLVLESATTADTHATELPSLGGGTALAGTTGATLVTDRTIDIPTYFNGHWIEITSAAGTLKGTWRVAEVKTRTLILEPDSSGETISVEPGDKWQGVYRFDNVRFTSAACISIGDPLRTANPIVINGPASNGWARIYPALETSSAVVITGRAVTPSIVADSITVESNAVLTHDNGAPRLSLAAKNTMVIRGLIDVTNRGYDSNVSHPSVNQPHAWVAGSHIGRGNAVGSNFTYDSVYHPSERGGGAYDGSRGGGVVRLEAGDLTLSGTIRANGAGADNRTGAGGSVWITTDRIDGTGSTIEARGERAYYEAGGGGAISIEYTHAASILPPTMNARGGYSDRSAHGGAGSIYVKHAGSKYGDLLLDSFTSAGVHFTDLAPMGKGVAQNGSAGATLVTDRATGFPSFFKDHWVEVGTNGTVKGTWRIANVDGKTLTLAPNGSETISVAPGDTWQGVYLFDTVTIRNSARLSNDAPFRLSTMHIAGPSTGDYARVYPVVNSESVSISGRVVVPKIVASKDVTIEAGASVTHDAGGGMSIAADSVSVKGTINLTGRGYNSNVSHPSANQPHAWVGGSHIGRGHSVGAGFTYGSIYRPSELGSGAYSGSNGGGVLRIEANSVTVDGSILANAAGPEDRTGAGGSVWITTKLMKGTGTIEARGDRAYYESGGGGAIAVEYTDPTSTLPKLSARPGWSDRAGYGGTGAVYVKGATSTYGDLIIDSAGTTELIASELPGLGSGVAQAGTAGATVVTDRTKDLPTYFGGHWIEITAPDGTLKGTWRIARVDAKTFTLAPNAAEEVSVTAGDTWQGVYRFDRIIGNNAGTLTFGDPLRMAASATLTGPATGGWLRFLPGIEAGTFTVTGRVVVPKIVATTLSVEAGANLTHDDGQSMTIKTDTLVVKSGGAIDLNGRGYGSHTSHPSAKQPHAWVGGSHIGRGYPVGAGYTYGSVYRPSERGSSAYDGSRGGGILRVEAKSVTVDGTVRANGGGPADRGGAGGSVWITTGTIKGTGVIEARGAERAYYEAGGGGALALEYTDASSVVPALSARGGVSDRGYHGGAGSVFVRRPTSTYGDLSLETTSVQTSELPSLGFGSALAGTSAATVVTSRAADIPTYFAGHWVEISNPDGAVKGTWRIEAVDGKSFTLEPNGSETISVVPEDIWRGVYRCDHLKLRNATVVTADRVDCTIRDFDSASTLTVNAAAPVFPSAVRSSVLVDSAPAGDAVIGAAGAVVDTDKPVKLTVTNTRTNATFTANASADGSFRVPVQGAAGDTFTIYAADSHSMPLTSAIVAVNGQIVEKNTLASLTVRPSTVTGGETAYGTVALTYPARAAGVTVSLSSSGAAASVPASVTIPGGQMTAQFPISTSASATTEATITATLTNSVSGTLTVLSGSSDLASITLSSSSVEGGESVDATVSLGAPAPAGGAVVLLSSTSPYVPVPPSITIAEGQLSETITLTTTRVAAAASAVIGAAYGSSASATLDLTACAAMESVTPPASVPMKTSWVNDAAPTGATVTGDATFVTTHAAAGTSSIYFAPPAGTEVRTFSFTGAAALAVAPTDTLVVYALVNPCNPPRQISVKWVESSTVSYTASWGESRIDALLAQYRAGAIPAGGQWVRLEVLAKDAGITAAKNLTGLTLRVDGGEAWIDSIGLGACALPKQPKPEYAKYETVWFDDSLPAGAVSGCDTYGWDISQTASGSASVLVPNANAMHQVCFTNATTPLTLNEGDVLFAYVLVDPCNPPRELMFQWHDGTAWNRRAYWGEDLLDYGARHTQERLKMDNLPRFGEWVRLEVPASMLGLQGQSVSGMAFTMYGGRAWFDRAGKYSRVNVALKKPATQSSTYQNLAGNAASGATDGDLETLNFTNNDTNSWLQVDLGGVYPVQEIRVENRTDQYATRLRDFDLFVSETPFTSQDRTTTINQTGVFRYHFQGTAGAGGYSFNIQRNARYVRLQLTPKEYLHIRELQVWAAAGTALVNVAGGSRASASSTYDTTTLAMNAFDGRTTDRHQSAASIFHTATNVHPWIETDLHSVQQISSIDVIRRADPYDSTGPVYVLVSDVPFTSKDLAATLAQPGVSAYHYAVSWDRPIAVNRTGRYVRVQRSATTASGFGFGEMRIWSHGKLIGALAKPADPTDSSTTD